MYKFEFILWLNFYDPVILGRKKNCRLKEGKRTSFLLRYSRILYGVYISSSSFTYTRRLSHIFLMFHISSHTHTHKWALHKLHAEIWIILITQRIETNIKDFFSIVRCLAVLQVKNVSRGIKNILKIHRLLMSFAHHTKSFFYSCLLWSAYYFNDSSCC